MDSFLRLAAKTVLILVTIAASLPQYARIVLRKSSEGISPMYALVNGVVAVEQLNLLLDFVVCADYMPPTVMHDPPTVGDWINLAQMATLWICASILVILLAVYNSSRARTLTLISLWLMAVITILLPCILQYVYQVKDSYVRGIYKGVHLWYLNPLVTLLAVVSLWPQYRLLQRLGSPKALSPLALLLQAVVYTVLAVSWACQLVDPHIFNLKRPIYVSLNVWWQDIGWAAVDHAIFAIVQAVLYIKCMRLGYGAFKQSRTDDAERTPLLK